MTRHLTLTQLTFLIAVAVGVAGLLVLVIYALHKALREYREEGDLKPKASRVNDPPVFALATMQGVLAGVKAQQEKVLEQSRAAEKRAEESARLLESIIREMPVGLMVFNREGFLTLSNPVLRELLGVDIWSRRRCPEILGPESTLTGFVRECLEAHKTYRREAITTCTPNGEARNLEMWLAPLRTRSGERDGAVLLLARPPDQPQPEK
jgi:PAS domain-containing protein